MATQVFRVQGTRNGKKFDDLAKVAGGRHTEGSLVQFYRNVNYKDYRGVTDLKAYYVGDEENAPIGEDGQPIPPRKLDAHPAQASSSSSGAPARPGKPGQSPTAGDSHA